MTNNALKISEEKLNTLRQACFDSCKVFAHTIEPHREYGACHDELFDWWQKCEAEGIQNTLALMPRDHQKSHCIAVWCCWKIYRNPAETIAYVCATESLAILQLFDIKQILESKEFLMLSPDMIEPREKMRAKWAETAIIVDHPIRKQERPRDPTVIATGLDSNNIGAHCTIMIKDDVVNDKNSETEAMRAKVEAKAGHLSSILTTDGLEFCVGTRYHPSDHYQQLIDMKEEVWDEETNEVVGQRQVYAVFSRVVEVDGVFLWPRKPRESDGKMFGFDHQQLARKKAKYLKNMRSYNCQYYNDPNAINEGGIDKSMFVYYDRDKLSYKRGKWFLGNKPLNVIAAIDFAYSIQTSSDSTCLMVIGMDWDKNLYVLDIDRFKTKKPSVYWEHMEAMYSKWFFKWVRAESVAAQEAIIEALKEYIDAGHYPIRIKNYKPNSASGDKADRISQTLEPLYDEGRIYHYRGGECTNLEEEVVLDRPPHDDIKDTLHIGVQFDKLKPPPKAEDDRHQDGYEHQMYKAANNRFGGYA